RATIPSPTTISPKPASPTAAVDAKATFSNRLGGNRLTTRSGRSSWSADVQFRRYARGPREGFAERIADRIDGRRPIGGQCRRGLPFLPSRHAASGNEA